MPERQPIIPSGASHNPNLSPGMRVGDFLFVSGHVSTDASGNVVGIGDCEAQSRQIMSNIRDVIAAAGGREACAQVWRRDQYGIGDRHLEFATEIGQDNRLGRRDQIQLAEGWPEGYGVNPDLHLVALVLASGGVRIS